MAYQPAIPDNIFVGALAALNATASLPIAGGYSATVVQLAGTWVGTITFEGTLDGTNWSPINGILSSTAGPSSTATTNGIYRLTPGGLSQIRANMTAYTSGSATINMRASSATGGVFFNQLLPSFASIPAFKIDQTTPGTTNKVSIGTDGTVSLNAALPAGTNIVGKFGIDQTTPGVTNAFAMTSMSLTGQAVSAVNTGDSLGNTGAIVTAGYGFVYDPVGLAWNRSRGDTTSGAWANVKALATGGISIGARPDGFLRTLTDPTTLLFDTFETLDTTNTWTIGGTNNPTGANGVLTIAANATVSATSYAISKPAFTPGSNAYLQFAALITVDGTATTGTNRFWGLGVITTPTTALPVTNGSIFEIDTAGGLQASTYSAGARTQTVALTKPTDGLVHRYAIYYKASRAYFEIDNVSVASIAFPNPAVSALSLIIGQANSGAVTGTNTMTSTLMGVADTGRNANQIADGLFPWREATVKPASTAVVATDTALVVGFHPTSPLPAGASIIGALVANQSVNTAQVGGTAIATGTGVRSAGTQRVTIATDDVVPVSQSGAWNINSITTLPSLVAGTAIVGKFGIDQTTPGTTNLVAVMGSDTTASGNITTQNLNPNSGAPTAGSTVTLATPGRAGLAIGVIGTYTGALSVQGTIDGTNWVTIGGTTLLNVATGVLSANIPSAATSIYQTEINAFAQVRVTALGAVTGTATVALEASFNSAVVAIDAALPTGTNILGALVANQSTNTAQINGVVPLMGNGVTGTGSQRVTIASDQTAFAVNSTLSAETTKVIGTINLSAAQTLATVTTVSTVTNLAQLGGVAVTMGSGVTGTGVQRVVLATDVPMPAPNTPTALFVNSAATTNATSVKASAGTLYSIVVSNSGAAAAFLKLYNSAAAPTVGTTAIALTIPIPASSVITVTFGSLGQRFATGIALAITNLVAETDATAVAANQVKAAVSYL